uniref:(northern house mosquito) hypothetical protein n=2 Tax=Culex pipiens TaxID=7175 RepID=A0A8D8MPQ7_CULPI
MDALLAEGVLRAVRPPVLLYADLRPGHAACASAAVRRRGLAEFGGDGGQVLDSLQHGGGRLVGRGSADRVPNVPVFVFGFDRHAADVADRYLFDGEYRDRRVPGLLRGHVHAVYVRWAGLAEGADYTWRRAGLVGTGRSSGCGTGSGGCGTCCSASGP